MRLSFASLLALFPIALGASAHAAPSPLCADLATPAGRTACLDAFIADPAAPPDLGAGGDNQIGINHRLGDLSFLLAFGRAPTPADPEALRMRIHLDLALAILRTRPATDPALAARRAAILAHLEAYRDRGTVPTNATIGQRNPIFIDEAGHICAVGYLIEQTAGRELADAVAARFRDAYIGDIHMPAFDAWVAGSGFTGAELALIQPAYSIPPLEALWSTFVGPLRLGQHAPDGAFEVVDSWHRKLSGGWKKKHMDGHWERRDAEGKLLGQGDFKAGKGVWRGTYPDGTLAAEGGIKRDAPEGDWNAFYPSGNVAAQGHFKNGIRAGEWTYYFDAPGKVVMARGNYKNTETGRWEHFDRQGRHIATSESKSDVVTWYDATGAASAAETTANDDSSRGSALAWNPKTKHAERMRLNLYGGDLSALTLSAGFAELEARFDADGHLATLIARSSMFEDPAQAPATIVRVANGAITDLWTVAAPADDKSPATVQSLAIPATPAFAKLTKALIAAFDKDARKVKGGATLPNRKAIARAADALLMALASATASPLASLPPAVAELRASGPFTPVFPAAATAARLLPPCTAPDGQESPTFCAGDAWAGVSDPAGQIQAAVVHLPTMVTRGANFVHLDAIASAMMAAMPDRVPTAYDPDSPLPAWWQMPEFKERNGEEKNLFGDYTSSVAPMIGLR